MKLSRILLFLFCISSVKAAELETTSTGDPKWDAQLSALAVRAHVVFEVAKEIANELHKKLRIDRAKTLEVITDSNINTWKFTALIDGREQWHPKIVEFNHLWLENAIKNYAVRYSVTLPDSYEVAGKLQHELRIDDFYLRFIIERANVCNQTLEWAKEEYLKAMPMPSANSLPQPAPSAPSNVVSSEGAQPGSSSSNSSQEHPLTTSSGGGSSSDSYDSKTMQVMRAQRLQIEELSRLWKMPKEDFEKCYDDHVVMVTSGSSAHASTDNNNLFQALADQVEQLQKNIPQDKIEGIKNECGIDTAQKLFRFFYIATDNPKNSPEENAKLYLKKYPRSVHPAITSSGSSSPTSPTSSSTSSTSSTSSAGDVQPAETKNDLTTQSKTGDKAPSVDTKTPSTGSEQILTKDKITQITHWNRYKYGYFIVGGAVAVSALVAVGAYWYLGKKKEEKNHKKFLQPKSRK